MAQSWGKMMGPTCIYCQHCDVAEFENDEFLICDLHGEERLKVVAMGDTCRDWFPGLLVIVEDRCEGQKKVMRGFALALVVAFLLTSFRGFPGVVEKLGQHSTDKQAIGEIYAYQN